MQATELLLQPVFEHPAFQNVLKAFSHQTAHRPPEIARLTRTAKAVVLAGLAHRIQKPFCVLSPQREQAEMLRSATATLLDWIEPGEGNKVTVLPPFDRTPYDGRSPHAEISERRAVALWRIAQRGARIVFVPAAAAVGRLREAVYYRSLALEIKTGDEINPGDLVEHLAGVGYEAQEPVDAPGSYSVRGGIADVYPPEAEWPFRIEFFGDQVESLREFDPATQRSRGIVSSAWLLPLSEHHRSRAFFEALARQFALRSNLAGPTARDPTPAPQYSNAFPGWEFFASLAEPHSSNLFEVCGDPVVVWDEAPEIERQIKLLREAWESAFDESRDATPTPPRPQDLLLSDQEFRSALAPVAQLSLKELEVEDSDSPPDGFEAARTLAESRVGHLTLPSQPPPKFHGAVKAWVEDLSARRARGERVVVALSSAGKMERFGETLR
ncbi:MAG: hypothetical protein ACRD2B_16495, partial [Terriglobia bacterium]